MNVYGSTVHGDFLSTNESTVVFGGSLGLQVHEPVGAIPSIVMVTHRCTSIVAHKVVLLVVSATQEIESAWVSVVANSFQNHVVTLLDGAEAYILHGLDEGQSASVCTLRLFLQMHSKS